MTTKKTTQPKTITFPHPPGAGGPGSFQRRFQEELKKKNWLINYAGSSDKTDLVFIVGGTKKIVWLWKMKLKNIPIVFRLDGINWLHKKKKVGFRNYSIAVLSNWTTQLIHAYIADKIVYQSEFVKKWWDDKGWRQQNNASIIHNGIAIPVKAFVENAIENRTQNRLVILEGIIDYSPYAIELLNHLAKELPVDLDIEIYGKFDNNRSQLDLHNRLQYKGYIEQQQVNEVMAGAVYLSLDINPACPNTVIEALACGCPVVAFDTGAIPELIDNTCGKVVPYGSNPWYLQYPDVVTLIESITEVFSDYDNYAKNAHLKAKQNFDINIMFSKYQKVFENVEV